MDGAADPALKRMRLRYAGTCRGCGQSLPAGQWALYDRTAKQVECLSCSESESASASPAGSSESSTPTAMQSPPNPVATEPVVTDVEPAEVESGTAGASARREHERRVAKRERAVREAHPRIGGFLLAITDDPQSTEAWQRGALGEELLGKRLDSLTDQGIRLLHDRRIPGTRANIDHIAITPTGVFVIDAKRYKGRPHLRVTGGLFRPRVETLLVGSRDCTKLVEGVHKQIDKVRAALTSTDSDRPGTQVRGMLCFVEADWPLIGGSFTVNGVDVLWPRKAAERLVQPGPLTADHVKLLHQRLADAFPPA